MSSKAYRAGCWPRSACVALAALCLLVGTAGTARAQRSLGLDISAWQGSISQTTWNNIHNVENREFVFLRSSRGGTTGYDHRQDGLTPADNNFSLSNRYDDPYFVQNINRATNAGMFAGPYHYGRADIVTDWPVAGQIPNDGADEANHFLQMAGPWMRPGYLLPVFDLEDGQPESGGTPGRSSNQLSLFAADFSNRIYEVIGVRPMIYTGQNYANYINSSVPAAFPDLWIARWPQGSGQPFTGNVQTDNPPPSPSTANVYGKWNPNHSVANPYPNGHPWKFWQYSSGERLQSFNNGNSNLDGDVANGGVEFLKDHLVPALWVSDSDGDWSSLANWNSGQEPIAPAIPPGEVQPIGTQTLPTPRLPGAAGGGVASGQHDTVILDRPNEDITVTLSTGTHNIRKLYVREALKISGGSLTVNYAPAPDSTPISGQFSAPVDLDGGSLSIHTLQVDVDQQFTLRDGSLTFETITLMPQNVGSARLVLAGNVLLHSLGGATANISNGAGSGRVGLVDLGGENREVTIADGAAAIDVAINVPVVNGGLTKAGTGTLALKASNTYDGDTAVQSGTLRLSTASLKDTADVHLSTGALLGLDFNGAPDVVDSLLIDGVSMQAGVWGAAGSGAEFSTDLITGTGFLQVTTFIPPPLWGDYNDDGVVDAADYVVWRDRMGDESALPNDDTPGVQADDYDRWKQNFGQTNLGGGSSASSATPEPSSALLLLIAGGALHRCYPRRSHANCRFRIASARRIRRCVRAQ